MLGDAFQNGLEGDLPGVIEGGGLFVFCFVARACCRVFQQESLIAGDMQVVALPEAYLLAGVVFGRPEEALYFGAIEQAIQVVVMAQEIFWEEPASVEDGIW